MRLYAASLILAFTSSGACANSLIYPPMSESGYAPSIIVPAPTARNLHLLRRPEQTPSILAPEGEPVSESGGSASRSDHSSARNRRDPVLVIRGGEPKNYSAKDTAAQNVSAAAESGSKRKKRKRTAQDQELLNGGAGSSSDWAQNNRSGNNGGPTDGSTITSPRAIAPNSVTPKMVPLR